MSYPTFSFGRICGPNFKTYAFDVTDSLQIGKYSTSFNSKCARVSDISLRAFSSLS